MRARELQRHLNTDRVIHAGNDYIYIASHYCHNLISFDINTGDIRYALGGSRPAEIQALINGLEALTMDQIQYYWHGVDEIENPIKIYYADDNGDIQEALTDSLDYPSVTHDGVMIYDNTHFKTLKETFDHAINDTNLAIDWMATDLEFKTAALEKAGELLFGQKGKLKKLESSLKKMDDTDE